MEIKESFKGEGKVIATTITIIIFILIAFIFIISKIKNDHKVELQSVYDKGYVDGYNEGFEKGSNEVINELKRLNK